MFKFKASDLPEILTRWSARYSVFVPSGSPDNAQMRIWSRRTRKEVRFMEPDEYTNLIVAPKGFVFGEREELLQTVAALPADVSVLLIEHDMDLVFSFANRMTVLVNGTVLTEGDPDTIANDPQVKAVYLGHGEGSSDAGPPQGARAPLGGSEPRAAGSVGAGGSHV